MTSKPHLLSGIALFSLVSGGCSPSRPPVPIPMPPPPSIVTQGAREEAQLRSTIVGGQIPVPRQSSGTAPRQARGGNVSLNLPQADVRTVAASVTQVTGIPIELDPGITGKVTLVTPGSVARAEIVGLFETALRAAQLALVPVGDGFVVRTEAAAKAPVAPDAVAAVRGQVTGRTRPWTNDELQKIISSGGQ